MLQDALSEVTKNYLPMKLRVFMDDITALLIRKNGEVAEMAKRLMKKLKEVEKQGLKLSVTEKGKKEKSKMIASCGFLEEELRQCSKEGGVTMADSGETLGVDLRTRVRRLGAKEEARRMKCKLRFSTIKKNKAFQKKCMKVCVKNLFGAGMVPARTWRIHAVGRAPTESLKLRRQMAAAAGKGATSLSLFMETYGLEVEEELYTMATQHWAEGVWTGIWYRFEKFRCGGR